MKKTYSVLLLLSCLVIQLNAQKTVKEWAEMPDKKFFKKMLFTPGIAHISNLAKSADEYPDIKRVGILSFSMIQPTYSDKTPYSVITPYLTDAGSQFFVDIFYADALPALKNKLLNHEVQLLVPEEYLDNETKVNTYNTTEFEVSGMFKFVGAMSNRIRGGRVDDVKGSPEGLKYVAVANADPKVWRAVGKFAGDMDLDAVLVIETTLGYDGKVLILQKITTSFIGPNTVPEKEADKHYYAPFGPLKGYLEGINYGSSEITSPAGGILLAKLKKGSVKESYFEGMGEVYGRIGEEVLARTNMEIEKSMK